MTPGTRTSTLATRLLAGEIPAVAKAITLTENHDPAGREVVSAIYARTGRARVIGITGPPGSGKSTLVDKLIQVYREGGLKVGVVAVDPTSPFTGGAILGDRIRMTQRFTDPHVFIRSMGSRGSLGGLSRAVPDAVRILDAAGYDVVMIETVGVGQAEVDIVRIADTVVIVAVPGMGDEVQNIKAGLMEIGDVFCVNKADRDGADKTAAELHAWLEFANEQTGWTPPIVKTIAENGDGVRDLADAITRHHAHMTGGGHLAQRRLQQAEHELVQTIRHEAERRALHGTEGQRERFTKLAHRVAAREVDPYAAARSLLE